MIKPKDRAAFDALLNPAPLIKGGRVTANWLPDGRFWFAETAPENTSIQVFDPAAAAAKPLFDIDKVRKAFRARFRREAPYQGLPFDSVTPAANGFTVTIEGSQYTLDAAGETLTPVPPPDLAEVMFGGAGYGVPEMYKRPHFFADTFPAPAMLSPDGRWFASLRDHDVWLRSAIDGRRERLTEDGEHLNGWDVESVRNTTTAGGGWMPILTSPWSPTSLKLFVTRFDQRGAKPWVRLRWSQRSDEIENTYMVRAGERLPAAAPYVIDILSRTLVKIDVPADDRILLLIGWNTDGSAVCFVQFSRDLSWAGVHRADASTGETRLLFEEKVETFLRIQHEVIGGRSGCTLLADGGFLWESERDGWTHLHHYDAKGKYVRQVTSGEWPVVDVQAVDEKAGFVYFTAHHDQDRPYDIHVCRVPLKGGSVERLTDEPGSHDVQFSPDRSIFVDTVSRPDTPPRSVVRRSTTGEVLHRFEPADITALKEIGWTSPEQASVKAADGKTDLWAVIYKPRDFDPSKSYPVIEHIYGGPQVTWAQHFFATPPYSMGMLNQALTQLGYVVVVLDARGTPERSKAFQDAVYKEWRRHVTADHAAAIRGLAKDRPWMDLGRVGMWGHSWGGYYTFANLIDNPDLYRAGLCSAPGFDPYDAFIYEPYLGGVPAAHNRAAYEDALLVTDAGKLESELMIVAGTNDMSVWQGSVRMADALIRAGKQHEFVLMPYQHHLYGGAHDTYFIEKFIGFWERTLKNAGEKRT